MQMTGLVRQKVELSSGKLYHHGLEVNLMQQTRFVQLVDGPVMSLILHIQGRHWRYSWHKGNKLCLWGNDYI